MYRVARVLRKVFGPSSFLHPTRPPAVLSETEKP